MCDARCTTPPAHEILSEQGLTLIKSLTSGWECHVQPLSTIAMMRQTPTKDFHVAVLRQGDFGRRRLPMKARAARAWPSVRSQPSLAGGACDEACNQLLRRSQSCKPQCISRGGRWLGSNGRKTVRRIAQRALSPCTQDERKTNTPCCVGDDEHAVRDASERSSRA